MLPTLRRGMAVFALAALVAAPTAALALDKVRLGKAVPNSFAFSTTEVGIEAKIFEKEGIEIEVTAFRGDAQLQQGLTAGSLEVGLGSGPGLGFRAKGALSIGVAAMYGPPANLALVLPFDTPVKTVADLKGKRIGVTTAGSLTDWLVRELSRQQGWGSEGIKILALGADAGAARRHPAWRARRHGDRVGDRLRARGGGQGQELHAVRRHRQGFLHPRHLLDRRRRRTTGRTCCGVSCAAGFGPWPS